jgi:ligand-binding sensor domain-containing protein/AraC-like DNA-binding protein
MKRYFSLIIIFISSICTFQSYVSAQELKAQLFHYTPADGLTSNSISDIIQDKYGYIWIATWNGLNRYDGYSFTNYTTGKASGIPFLHNRIFKLSPDKYGNIWMEMYDGRVFVLIRKTDRIVNAFTGHQANDIITERPVFCSPSGKSYMIIKNKGIFQMYFDAGNIKSKFIHIQRRTVNQIVFDNKGNLWLSTDNGLICMDEKSGKIKKVHWMSENITSVSYKKNHIYAGTKSGKLLVIVNGVVEKTIKELQEKDVTSVYMDDFGLLWFSTEKEGISRLNTKTGQIKSFAQTVNERELDLHGGRFTEAGGLLWASMTHGGFGYYQRATDRFSYFYNSPENSWNLSNTVPTYLSLPEGVIWMSTIKRGLEKLEILKERIKLEVPEPGSRLYGVNEIRAMLQDDNGDVWTGNKAGMLCINRHGKIKRYDHDGTGRKFGRIYGLMKDSRNRYWMSTKGNGLYLITKNGEDLTFTNYKYDANNHYSLSSNNVYITEEDKYGNIWVATYDGGINLISKDKNGKTVFYNYKNKMHSYPHESYLKARTLAADNNGNVWAGTSDGILIFRYENGIVHIKKIRSSEKEGSELGSNDIVQIKKDNKGVVWIATNGGGLCRTDGMDDNGDWKFRTYGSKEGLPSDEIRGITFDKLGNVWFTTDQQLCSYDIRTHLFTIYSIQDGVGNVMCSEGAAITMKDGKMLFGTLNGYYIVDRTKLVNEQGSTLKLQITDFLINDELISPRLNDIYNYYIPESKMVKIPNRTSVFAFKFISLNYQLQHRVHYQYKLEGYDKQWRNADVSRIATYSDVPAGTYTFKVKAFLLESPDKYDIKTITVIVPPYLLASTMALWIYLVLFITGIMGFVYHKKRIRTRKLKDMRVLKIGPQEIAFKHKDDYDFVVEQQKWLEEKYSDANLKIEDVAAHFSISRTSYYNKVKELTGMSPREFIKEFRIKKAMMYLEHDDCTVAEVAYKCGFNDPVYFTRIFRETMKVTPTVYRERTRGLIKKTKTQKEKTQKEENNLED